MPGSLDSGMSVRGPSPSGLSTRDANRDRRFGDLAASIGPLFLSTPSGFAAAVGGGRILEFFNFFLAVLVGSSGSGTPLRTHPMRCIAAQNSYGEIVVDSEFSVFVNCK